MSMTFARAALFIAVASIAAPTPAQAPLTVAEARQSLVGRWQGKLEYRDYQADRWIGLPVKVQWMMAEMAPR